MKASESVPRADLVRRLADPHTMHVVCMQEERMDPPPDFGYDTYEGHGKLKNKV